MRHRLIQWFGIAWTLLYAALVVWLYAADSYALLFVPPPLDRKSVV